MHPGAMMFVRIIRKIEMMERYTRTEMKKMCSGEVTSKTKAEISGGQYRETRADTRQSSRGRLGRSSNAKTAQNSKM